MTNDYFALLKNTWILVSLPPNQHIDNCQLIFKLKHKANGSIERHKAHLVAKDFHQQAGVNFNETFSLVIKPTVIHMI